MLELFNEMPRDLLHTGKNSNRWFTSEGSYFILFYLLSLQVFDLSMPLRLFLP